MKSSITPKKSLGQNFMANPRILGKIVAAAEITKKDIVLEIGPGTGNLTQKLAEKAGRVIAVEKDRRLIEGLKEKFSAYGGPAAGWKSTNIEIVEGDILKLDIWTLFRNSKLEIRNSNYKVIGNIPYYITSNLLRTIFDPSSRTSSDSVRYGSRKWPKPRLIVLMIQKEVAQRIMARPPKMNLLALSVQFYSQPKIIAYVSKENFRPRPKVDSAIIRLVPKEKLPTKDIDGFFKIVRAGFSQKRKLLVKNLAQNSGILKKDLLKLFEKIEIEQNARAENLSLNQWLELTKYIKRS